MVRALAAAAAASLIFSGCAGAGEEVPEASTATVEVTSTVTHTATITVTEEVTVTADSEDAITDQPRPTATSPRPTSERASGTQGGGLEITESGWGHIYDRGVSWGVVVRNDSNEDLRWVELAVTARDADGTLLDSGRGRLDGLAAGESYPIGGTMHEALGVDTVEYRIGDQGRADNEGPAIAGSIQVDGSILMNSRDGGHAELGFEVANNTDFELRDLLAIGFVYRDAQGAIVGGDRALLSSVLGPGESAGQTFSKFMPAVATSLEARANYDRDQFGNP